MFKLPVTLFCDIHLTKIAPLLAIESLGFFDFNNIVDMTWLITCEWFCVIKDASSAVANLLAEEPPFKEPLWYTLEGIFMTTT